MGALDRIRTDVVGSLLRPDYLKEAYHQYAEGQLDADGLHLFPGLVDVHAHWRTPGREDEETIESGSAAAAAGGFTGVVMMPNTEEAARAIAGIDGHRLRGRRLVVNQAVKKNKLAKQMTASAEAGDRGEGGGGMPRRVRASSASRPRRGGRNPRRGR